MDPDFLQVVPRLVARYRSNEPYSDATYKAVGDAEVAELGEHAPIRLQIAGYVDLLFGIPLGDFGFVWISHGKLGKSGMSLEQLKRIALQNLDRFEETAEVEWLGDDVGACLGDMTSSLLLSDRFWARHNCDKSKITVMFARKDQIIFLKEWNKVGYRFLEALLDDHWSDEEVPDNFRLCPDFVVHDAESASGWALAPSRKQQ